MNTRALLIILLCVGFALRFAASLLFAGMHYPDEVFQTLEPAHRLAFGPGVVTWEWVLGTRSWVVPAVLAAIMRATAWMGPGSIGYISAIKAVLCLLSLLPIYFGYKIGKYVRGDIAGLLCAGICAFWYQLVYFAPRALTEVIAAHLLIVGIYYAAFDDGEVRKRLFLAGFYSAFALMLRVHIAPAVLVLMLYVCRKDVREKWLPMIAGMMPPILLFGAADWIGWSYPFQSTYLNFTVNLVQHKAARFGVEAFNFYVRKLVNFYSPVILFSVIAAVTIRRARLLAYIVLAIVIPHSLLAHKEFRFIYPALPLLLILAGLAIWDCAGVLREKLRSQTQWKPAVTLAVVVLLVITPFKLRSLNWFNDAAPVAAMQKLSHTPDVCGVGMRGLDWSDSGGYSYLHRDVPIYATDFTSPYADPVSPEAAVIDAQWRSFRETAPAFNYVITVQGIPFGYPEYQLVECTRGVCIYRRPGGCTPIPGYSLVNLLRLSGQ